jgi:ubiquinone/menaquinone biosynthesis C-methylase UbiE
MTTSERSLDQRLLRLFNHLGFSRAHVGYHAPRDLTDLLRTKPDAVASVTVVSARAVDITGLAPLSERVMFIRGDVGPAAPTAPRALAHLPGASVATLQGYQDVIWGDMMAERTNEVSDVLLDHLAAVQAVDPLPYVAPLEAEGWIDDIWFHVEGSGPPLALFPIALSPSQWEPLIPRLRQQYCTVTLGGPLLGAAGNLEERARMPWYQGMLRNLLAVADPRPDDSIVEVGCGPGAVARFVVEHTGGANSVLGIDINRYLLREARSSVSREGLGGLIAFREGSAEDLPLESASFDVTLCVTVLEEGDAARMLSELVRVTRSGGRVAIMVRAVDIPLWISLPLSESVMAKVVRSGSSLVAERGCADASLAQRMISAGLRNVSMTPQLAALAPGAYTDSRLSELRAELSADEPLEWDRCKSAAEIAGTLTLASPFYLAVGMKL